MSTDASRLVRASIGTLFGLAGMVVGLTWIFLGTRVVLSMGGSCASGGPYVIANPCPDGVPLAIIGGLFLGIISMGGYGMIGLKAGPRLLLLGWPALFLSLSWNFFEFGVNPPVGEGVDGSLLFAAVMFVVMGGGPLLFLLNRDALKATFWSDPQAADQPSVPLRLDKLKAAKLATEPRRPDVAAQPSSSEATSGSDLSQALERLHRLHSEGALTDQEYAAAKRRLLE